MPLLGRHSPLRKDGRARAGPTVVLSVANAAALGGVLPVDTERIWATEKDVDCGRRGENLGEAGRWVMLRQAAKELRDAVGGNGAVAACRPTVNGKQVHTPGELGVAVFTHHTSRPTSEVAAESGRPPDPQLHSHAFVFNLAWCQGRYLGVDSRPIYQFAGTAEAIYACQFAAELQRLGYRLNASWEFMLHG